MFFALKFLQALLLPPSGIILLMAIGLVLSLRKKAVFGRFLIVFSFALLYGLSIQPVSEALMNPLETSHPPLTHTVVAVDDIVVLGGGVTELSRLGLAPELTGDSTVRLVKGVALWRAVQKPILISGGTGLPVPGTALEADAGARTARELGVPEKDLVIENRSRNTVESAQEVRKILTGNRIILVTSAFHMKRAVAIFKKQGFQVVPAPAGYKTEGKPLTSFSFIPQAASLAASSLALNEYLGLLWYSLTGDL